MVNEWPLTNRCLLSDWNCCSWVSRGTPRYRPCTIRGGQVRGRHVVVVRTVVHGGLPVHWLHPLDGTQGLGAVVQAVEIHVQEPAGVTEVVFQAGGGLVPGGENYPGVGVQPGLHQSEPVPVQRTVVCLFLTGQVLQCPLVGVGPTMVSAGEVAGVSGVGPNNPVTAVAAHVQEGPKAAPGVAAENDRLLAHVGVEVVIHPGYERLVADHKPGPGRTPFLAPRRKCPRRRICAGPTGQWPCP